MYFEYFKKEFELINSKIPGEILDDDFSVEIEKISKIPKNKIFVEIGSSAGEGSTKHFIEGISSRVDMDECKFYCLEVSQPRLDNLIQLYGDYPFFIPKHNSSIALNDYPSFLKVIYFLIRYKSNLRKFSVARIYSWFKLEKINIKLSLNDFNSSGIDIILDELHGKMPDVALIDGSEFTGFKDLEKLFGSRYILLDDIRSFKCFQAHRILLDSAKYNLITENINLRNGFAIHELIVDE